MAACDQKGKAMRMLLVLLLLFLEPPAVKADSLPCARMEELTN
jgi:hypothetical protein